MTIEDLKDLKKYVRQGSPALNVMDYVGDPIDNMLSHCSEDDITIRVSHAQENANEDDTLNTSYGRVLVEAKIDGYDILDSGATVGFVYALDKQVPEFRTYYGHTVFACTNLCISADEDVSSFRDNHKLAHAKFKEYISSLDKEKERFIEFHNTLQNKELSLEDLETTIGHLLRRAIKDKTEIGTSSLITGYKSVVKPGSKYSITNDSTDMWNLYNAVTEVYSKKFTNNTGIFERPGKTKQLSNLMHELCS